MNMLNENARENNKSFGFQTSFFPLQVAKSSRSIKHSLPQVKMHVVKVFYSKIFKMQNNL